MKIFLKNFPYILHCIFCISAMLFMGWVIFSSNSYEQTASVMSCVHNGVENKNISNDKKDIVFYSSETTGVGYRYENGESVAYINGVRHVLEFDTTATIYIGGKAYEGMLEQQKDKILNVKAK